MAVLDHAAQRHANGEAFALATVVRTVSVTAAKAGAKAIISADGSIDEGWIGGGCARAAVLKAARQSMLDGQSRLVSIAPKELLAGLGVAPGDARAGVLYARNSCPSQGTMDIFVEPVLPSPRLLILGASPVAVALAPLAAQLGFSVTVAAPAGELGRFSAASAKVEGFALPQDWGDRGFIVVSTQGAGDRVALKLAASVEFRYAAFVGSRRKAAALRAELGGEGVSPQRLAAIKAPAGIDLCAITSEEIALSILAEMVLVRRRVQRAEETVAVSPPAPSLSEATSP
ncbi:MAG TPA: XdhC family protein [Roseiarcus sp.]|jgi:xanthine dehydrogenase accessory factor